MQLRFNDIDTLGHLNNTVYFELFDLAKGDYFSRVRGDKMDWNHVPIMAANINCNFLAQTYFDEHVEVLTQLERMGDKSFTLLQQLVNVDSGEVKCECRTIMVYFDLDQRQPTRVAQDWRDDLAQFEQRPELRGE